MKSEVQSGAPVRKVDFVKTLNERPGTYCSLQSTQQEAAFCETASSVQSCAMTTA